MRKFILPALTLVWCSWCCADDPTVLLDDTKSPRNIAPTKTIYPKPKESNYEKNFIFKELGLKEGDKIKSVDGKILGADDMDVVSVDLRTLDAFTVVIDRDGHEKTIHYRKKK